MRTVKCLFGGLAVPALLVVFICATAGVAQAKDKPSYFREASAADLVVGFSSWEAIAVSKPQLSEGKFAHFYTRAEVPQVLSKLSIQHRLAVIVVGFRFSPTQQAELEQGWAGILGELGFERVVFLRPNGDRPLNGLVILRDMRLEGSKVAAQ